jgi:type IV pilus assembly protein PilE
MKRIQQGFTLIEVMITVAIVGILAAVAIPAYTDYVIRARLTEAFSTLSGAQTAAEQYWSTWRDYAQFDSRSRTFPQATPNFTYALSNATPSTYIITATGINKAAGFVYTINQDGTHATTASPPGWGTNANCWVDHKGGTCSN